MIKLRRLSLATLSLVMLLVFTTNAVFAETKSSNDTAKVLTTEDIAENGNVIELFAPNTRLEAIEIARKVYAETPSITMAEEVTENTFLNAKAAENMPYYFSFDFDSTLTSSTIVNNTAGTIRITASGDWVQSPNVYSGTQYDYYDITLYAGGVSKGTKRFKTGSWKHADWTNVPTGNIYFVMTKSYYTYTGAYSPDYIGDIVGDGAILNQ
ncbi:MAG: hypothetical protein NAG76_08570 [Candidatus Pristimantibacillus lignocellulolyticus]|uniref:Uncharacterized protein n=1 Tax=Candidatus Pristimantibacillus lignocellulolyticus TaxID=2994561 RepID=A0A9J6ZJ98_9BACL|nr:MAG: hypothetical protein NAG76_08570 [Candidatus Pristimantibacillus lignocellulolyticus]